jgi:hypothetical protein
MQPKQVFKHSRYCKPTMQGTANQTGTSTTLVVQPNQVTGKASTYWKNQLFTPNLDNLNF